MSNNAREEVHNQENGTSSTWRGGGTLVHNVSFHSFFHTSTKEIMCGMDSAIFSKG